MKARHDDLAALVLQCLGVAVFEESHGLLSLESDTPPWMSQVWDIRPGGTWDFGGPFSFLENFLEDCRMFWASSGPENSLASEPWTQRNRNGEEVGLRALAVKASGRSLLAVELLGASHEFNQRALQRARDRGLENYRLESQAIRLANRNAETERLNRLKRDFLAQMSHELRTPLNSISGFSALLAQGKAGELNPKQNNYVANVLTAAGHLQNLIDDVMDLSRIEAGHFPLEISLCEMGQMASELAVLLGPKSAAKNVTFTSEIEDGGFPFEADRLRILQILSNLIGNAIKFTPSGGEVALRAGALPDRVVFTVSDTGAGIAATELPYIFDKFQQFPKPGASANRGAGLGLAIAKGLVDLHGGTIAVTSETGAGSKFTVTIPQPAPREE
jgi:signal transduction histidine kinase